MNESAHLLALAFGQRVQSLLQFDCDSTLQFKFYRQIDER